MKKKLSKLELALKKIAAALQAYVNDHIANIENPHGVTKTLIGLGNVGNFKAVSTEANQGLTDTEKGNARANIGAGTSSFSGSYNDLLDKPTIPSLNGYATESWVSGKINDLVGIDASGVSALAAVLADNDTTTGLLTLISGKVDNNDSRLSDSRPASDVYSWAKASSKPSYSYSEISNTPSSLPASDVYDWAKASTKPSYSYSEISNTPSSLPANGGNADTVDDKHAADFASRVIHSNMTTDIPTDLVDGIHIIHRPDIEVSTVLAMHDYNGGYFQIYHHPTEEELDENVYFRSNNTGGSWRAFIDSSTIGSQSVNYANSAGNADTVDGCHENNFLRYREQTETAGDDTLWSQIGIKQYLGVLPEDIPNGTYTYGSVISLPGSATRFDIYCSHLSSSPNDSGNGLYYRSGWQNDKKAWTKFIDSNNIGSQSVNYATTAGSAPANGGNAATVNNHSVNADVPSNAVFTDTTYSTMGASGNSHAGGLVPDPGATLGNTRFLREDGTWEAPTAISSSFINSLFE